MTIKVEALDHAIVHVQRIGAEQFELVQKTPRGPEDALPACRRRAIAPLRRP